MPVYIETSDSKDQKAARFPQGTSWFVLTSVTPTEREYTPEKGEQAGKKVKDPGITWTWEMEEDMKNAKIKPADRRKHEVVTGRVFGSDKATITRHMNDIFGRQLEKSEAATIDTDKVAAAHIRRPLMFVTDRDYSGETSRFVGIAQDGWEALDPKAFPVS